MKKIGQLRGYSNQFLHLRVFSDVMCVENGRFVKEISPLEQSKVEAAKSAEEIALI